MQLKARHLLSISRHNRIFFIVILLIWPGILFPDICCFSLERSAPRPSSFVAFESGHVRPLGLSPSGKILCAVNTPDNRLEVFDAGEGTLKHRFSVPVGMEPIAVSMPDETEAWVVNNLSDSVSVVRIGDTSAGSRVVRTLLTGDEPQDIVFAGAGKNRAFITCAHRGQNVPYDPQLTVQGVGRADVWVFDRKHLGAAPGGEPETIVTLFGDSPRALTVSPDSSTVYAAIFHSGNQTTTVTNIPYKPEPTTTPAGVEQPKTGLIVRCNGKQWVDETGADYSAGIFLTLPDYDVFALDAAGPAPRVTARYSGVGTTLFNMAVNPANGSIYVSNTEARNHVRFEGSGHRGTTLRGHVAESRITVINGRGVYPRHLNKHLDYNKGQAAPEERRLSIANPQALAVTADGSTLYVAAFGSQKVVRIDTAALENDSLVPRADDFLVLSAGGPSGLALDEQRQRLYVFTRFNNSISVIDLATFSERESCSLYNPEPESIIKGRPFLYDAALTSGFGDSSCSECHVFGDADGLAWDLGNPDLEVTESPNEYAAVTFMPPARRQVHPLKGPKVTQSLRGIADSGPLHWRGDRSGVNRAAGESVESAAFKEFNAAFETLLGRETRLTAEQMQQFADFALQITYPPNPVRALDNSLTMMQAEGKRIFYQDRTAVRLFSFGGPVMDRCIECHELDPAARRFGTGGKMVNVRGSQDMKVPQLRNIYQKIGMFDMDSLRRGLPAGLPQIRGFGFSSQGTVDTLLTHFRVSRFDLRGGIKFASEAGIPVRDSKANALTEYLLAFDSNLAPVVGQQMTLCSDGAAIALDRIELFIQRAGAHECDVVVKGSLDGESRGWVMTAASDSSGDIVFQSDRMLQQHTFRQLQQIALQTGQELTFTCVPPGAGKRIGIDRNENGTYDADEMP